MFSIIKSSGWSLLLLAVFSSCQKAEPVETWRKFVNVSFDATKTALTNNGAGLFMSAKYNGHPIAWDINLKKIKVVEGEGKFEFLDTRTGNVVAEKTLDVKEDGVNQFFMFQPTLESPVTFYHPSDQDSEEAAPEGHIKLKLANYTGDLIPFSKVDVKVFIMYYDENWNEVKDELGIIRDIAGSVDEAGYNVLPDGLFDGIMDYAYIFEFYDGTTGEPLMNHGGTTYICNGIFPVYLEKPAVKNVYTIYLTPNKAWGEAPPFIKKGEEFYEVYANILYVN